MSKCLIIIILILGILALITAKTYSSTERYDEIEIEPNDTHGIDPGCFPSLPREIKSPFHSSEIKDKINKAGHCGKCEKLEKLLVADGKQVFEGKLPRDPEIYYKDFGDCELCKIFLDGWKRYFIKISHILSWLKTNQLPPMPKTEHYSCKNCMMVQQRSKEYAEKTYAETECIVSGNKDCPKVNLPDFDYGIDENCSKCEEIYIKWAVYTFALIDIANYYNCARTHAKK